MQFSDLKANLARDFSGLPRRRLALLGDSATQFLAKAIKAYGYQEKIHFEIHEADFDQLNHQILDAHSELYQAAPEFIVLYLAAEKLLDRFAGTAVAARAQFAEQVLAEIRNWWETIARHCPAKVIHFNFVEINDAVFGHFATRVPASFPFQLKRLNFELMQLAQGQKHVFLADVAGLAAQAGYAVAHDPRLYATSKVALALDFLPAVAKAVTDIVQAVSGQAKKCLILDLDNTLWGGVIGDDGMENLQLGDLGMGHAYDHLQRWARELQRRGIILAVCSKNNEDTAKQPFREHPDMILRLEDIAVFVANWDNKVDNLKLIQSTLNIGFDAMVFLDDNPFERNLVREHLPAVTVPELPEDPALYVAYLAGLNLFETASFSEEDLQRTRQYQAEAARSDFQKSFTSIDDYLQSLDMVSEVKPFDDFSLPRVAQLTQRSNQFNLRTVRYTVADIDRLRAAPDHLTLSFQLADKFGDHGLVGLVILKQLDATAAFIDTWIMSCRVLKRGMEEFIVNQMVRQARARGLTRLIGEYLPTPKNNMVKNLYGDLGFAGRDGRWELDLERFEERRTFIRAK
ncbi:MAG: HAD-IIIC family phosphatase [Verrucomicrobiae bacterium]|nr:HAD-IIIC family phosphatase [Verrucomicrobiae bacterium]